MQAVVLVPVGAVEAPLLDYLSLMIREVFRCSVRVETYPLSPDFAYDPVRRQFNSTLLLERLEVRGRACNAKVLGVSDGDLFVPIFTFIFGEARLHGAGAIMSVARLRQSFYGLPEDPRLLYHRAEKEALHELGHAHGLTHCRDYGCVMHGATIVEELDVKGDRFCRNCAAALEPTLPVAPRPNLVPTTGAPADPKRP